jgi:hypothetical protein
MKSQSTVEFMIIIAALLVGLAGAMYAGWAKSIEIGDVKTNLEAEKILNQVAGKINTVLMEGDGFRINMTLPEQVAGFNYTLEIQNYAIILDLSGRPYVSSVMVENISGDFSQGVNTLENRKGMIFVY